MASTLKVFAGSNIKEVSQDVTLAAAGNYDDEDVLSESASAGTAWNFDEISSLDGGVVYLEKAVITIETTDIIAALTLHLFNITPTGETNDRVANDNPNAADKEEYQGAIEWPAMDNNGGISTAVVVFDPPMPLGLAKGDDSIFGVLVTNTAFTNEAAAMKCLIKLMVREKIDV